MSHSSRYLVLLHDSDSDVLRVMAKALSDDFYKLETAHSISELLAKLGMNPHLIIADLDLPENDRLRLLKAVSHNEQKSQSVHCPVLFASSVDSPKQLLAEVFASGAADILIKPYTAAYLKTKIRILLGRLRTEAK